MVATPAVWVGAVVDSAELLPVGGEFRDGVEHRLRVSQTVEDEVRAGFGELVAGGGAGGDGDHGGSAFRLGPHIFERVPDEQR